MRAFEQVSACPRGQNPLAFAVRFESSQDDDPCFGKLSPNRDRGIDAAHIRKPEVHQSDIGLVFTKTFDRLASACATISIPG